MKKVTILLVILFFLTIPLSALATETAGAKAKTIDELAAMYDVSSCEKCHSETYHEWEQSAHARAMVGSGKGRVIGGTQGYLKGIMAAKYSGLGSVKDFKVSDLEPCYDCHLPQLEDASDAVAQEVVQAYLDGDSKKLNKLQINCLVCHNKRAKLRELRDGPPEPNVIYSTSKGTSPHPDPGYKTRKQSPNMADAAFCGKCHGLGPTFRDPEVTQCATLYGSYLHAYIPAGGNQTCQDCHMEKGSHRWPGFITQGDTVTQQPNRAFDVNVTTTAYQFLERTGNLIPKVLMTVEMTNKAGHRIPDG
jgi:hypothetical protein